MATGAPGVAVDVGTARASVVSCFTLRGVSHADAVVVADQLLETERAGVRTHGLIRVQEYCDQIDSGSIDPAAVCTIDPSRFAGVVGVDGANALGPVVARFALEHAMQAADRAGLAVAVARGANHLGALGVIARAAAEAGYVCMLTQSTFPTVAPWGGAEPVLGNNPFAWALPGGHQRGPIVLDIACSAVSRGRLKAAAAAGDPIPAAWALDASGRPTTDPVAALAGILLPFGEHKGSGLSVVLGALSGVLAGAAFGAGVPRPTPGAARDVGFWLLLVKVDALLPVVDYRRRIDEYADQIAGSAASATAAQGVRLPGERMTADLVAHRSTVQVTSTTWDMVTRYSQREES